MLIRPFRGEYPVTQEWGVNKPNYTQFGLLGHNGFDYGLPMRTPIIAPHGGTVLEVANDEGGYGYYVKIENDEEGSILAHLSEQYVYAGQVVAVGDDIGLSNNSGNSTGPHLHWGYYRKPRNKGDGYSGTTDPTPYLVTPTSELATISERETAVQADRIYIGMYDLGLLDSPAREKNSSETVLTVIQELLEILDDNRKRASLLDRVVIEILKFPSSIGITFQQIKDKWNAYDGFITEDQHRREIIKVKKENEFNNKLVSLLPDWVLTYFKAKTETVLELEKK